MENIGDSIVSKNARWTFGGDVSDEHIFKSVTLYKVGHDLVTKVSDFFINNESVCYELGCSTGALIYDLAKRNEHRKTRFIGVDVEESMIKKAKERCQNMKNVSFKIADVMDVEFEKADLILAYYSVQFVLPRNRQVLIDRIFQSLNWGGVFILF